MGIGIAGAAGLVKKVSDAIAEVVTAVRDSIAVQYQILAQLEEMRKDNKTIISLLDSIRRMQ